MSVKGIKTVQRTHGKVKAQWDIREAVDIRVINDKLDYFIFFLLFYLLDLDNKVEHDIIHDSHTCHIAIWHRRL